MILHTASSNFLRLSRKERETLFLDIIRKPAFRRPGSWGEWFHHWLEDQCAEGRALGQIAERIDLPAYFDDGDAEGWHLIERHVCWLLNEGYARLVRIEVVA